MDKQFAYQQRALTPTSIWLLFLFLGWSYGSMGQMGKQLLYYITFGGFDKSINPSSCISG